MGFLCSRTCLIEPANGSICRPETHCIYRSDPLQSMIPKMTIGWVEYGRSAPISLVKLTSRDADYSQLPIELHSSLSKLGSAQPSYYFRSAQPKHQREELALPNPITSELAQFELDWFTYSPWTYKHIRFKMGYLAPSPPTVKYTYPPIVRIDAFAFSASTDTYGLGRAIPLSSLDLTPSKLWNAYEGYPRIEMHWFTRAGEHPYFDR